MGPTFSHGRRLALAALMAAIPLLAASPAGAATLSADDPPNIGTRALGPGTDTLSSTQAEAFAATAKVTGPVDAINVYVATGTTAGWLNAGIYADNNGHPGTLLGQAQRAGVTRGAWNTVALPAAASLTKGSRYWIAVQGHGGILNVRTSSPGKGTDNSETHRTLGGNSLPTTWRTGAVYRNDAPLSAYAVEKYSVLVFTKNASGNVAEGVAGLRALADAQEVTFDVSDDAGKFTDANLAKYRAVVFLNNTGDVLDDAQQTAFEKYFRAGGGFLGINSAIEVEPDWAFMTNLLGTRGGSKTDPLSATIKVADRGHLASKGLPEYWTRTDRWYNFTSNVRGFSHVLATVDENTYSGGTMGFDHPIAWCKDYQGGRSFYTGGGGTADTFSEAASASTSPAHSTGPPARRTRSTATAARPCSRTSSRPRSRLRRTSTSRSASTAAGRRDPPDGA